MEDLKKPEVLIQVGGQQYPPGELTKYVIFENEIAVVYDFTAFFIETPFEEYIKSFYLDENVDINWAKECYEILQENKKKLINPC